MERFGFLQSEENADVGCGIFDPDGSVIMAISEMDQSTRLLVWDFRISRPFDRYFERVMIGDLEIWLCFEAL